ncbi:MAG: ATP-binding protein, partial [Myxococcales bacterium]|nr:ATP-binding protein [Myxococcales bacterium]
PNYTCTRIHEGIETFDELFAQDTDHRDTAPNLGVTLVAHPDLAAIGQDAAFAGHHLADDVLRPQLDRQRKITDILTLDGAAPPLAQFIELSQYVDARLILSKTSATVQENATRWVFANHLARFTTKSGNEFSHPQLSFGEKRLLAFLIKFHAYKHTIIADELANGMHHSWLERMIELMGDNGTQAFLTSQNPLLLDCLPYNRETFDSEHTLTVCELSDSGEMIWRNLDDIEREDLLRSLEVGLQHVSAIMRSKGLW